MTPQEVSPPRNTKCNLAHLPTVLEMRSNLETSTGQSSLCTLRILPSSVLISHSVRVSPGSRSQRALLWRPPLPPSESCFVNLSISRCPLPRKLPFRTNHREGACPCTPFLDFPNTRKSSIYVCASLCQSTPHEGDLAQEYIIIIKVRAIPFWEAQNSI